MSKQDVSLTQQEPVIVHFFFFLSEMKFQRSLHNFLKLFSQNYKFWENISYQIFPNKLNQLGPQLKAKPSQENSAQLKSNHFMQSGVSLEKWIVLFSFAERSAKAQDNLFGSLGLIPKPRLQDSCV